MQTFINSTFGGARISSKISEYSSIKQYLDYVQAVMNLPWFVMAIMVVTAVSSNAPFCNLTNVDPNTVTLPPLEDLLVEIGMENTLEVFYSAGIQESYHMLGMSDMDLKMMVGAEVIDKTGRIEITLGLRG